MSKRPHPKQATGESESSQSKLILALKIAAVSAVLFILVKKWRSAAAAAVQKEEPPLPSPAHPNPKNEGKGESKGKLSQAFKDYITASVPAEITCCSLSKLYWDARSKFPTEMTMGEGPLLDFILSEIIVSWSWMRKLTLLPIVRELRAQEWRCLHSSP